MKGPAKELPADTPGIRTFIALELHPGIRASLASWQETLRFRSSTIRWVAEANLHLTLQFLGEVKPDRIASVGIAVAEAARRLRPFWLEVGGVGAFPDWHRPRVLWAGLAQARAETRDAARQVAEALDQAGISRDGKSFTPHVTLGRVKHWQGGTPPERLKNGIAGAMTIEKVTVMRSDLRSGGSIYTPLFVYQFVSGEAL